METEPIGELSNFLLCGFLFIASITLFVSAWMTENKNGKISRIAIGLVSIGMLVAVIIKSKK